MFEEEFRPFGKYIKENYKDDLIGLEIGVSSGGNALKLLNELPNLNMLYLVDPFEEYLDERILRSYISIKPTYLLFKKNLLKSPLKDRIKFIKKKSLECLNEIQDDLDFIYIDGNHSYDVVNEEIKQYYKKIKVGGVFGGDDYNFSRFPGVTKAVDEFVKEHNLKLYTESYEYNTSKIPSGIGINYNWWVIK